MAQGARSAPRAKKTENLGATGGGAADLGPDLGQELTTDDRDVRRRDDAEDDPVALDPDDPDFDRATELEDLARAAGEDEHRAGP